MAAPQPPPPPSLKPEVGPDGLARDAPVIAYTEKLIEEEQLHLKKGDAATRKLVFLLPLGRHCRLEVTPLLVGDLAATVAAEEFPGRCSLPTPRYIQENYSKIRDVEKELEGLTLEMKLTAGPKKAALEHLRKKVEMSTERIRLAKAKEEQAKKAWEAAAQVVKEEEDAKQKICDDLNRLVQESAASQYSRLEELKKRLESLNPSRASVYVSGLNTTQNATTNSVPEQSTAQNPANATGPVNNAVDPVSSVQRQGPAEAEKKRRPSNSGRGRGGVMILPKGRGSSGSGWTGAGFDVVGGT